MKKLIVIATAAVLFGCSSQPTPEPTYAPARAAPKNSYGAIAALKGVDLRVEEGEVVTLVGANGAGKSTTLKAIAGVVRPRAGEIHLFGDRVTAARGAEGAGEVCHRDRVRKPAGLWLKLHRVFPGTPLDRVAGRYRRQRVRRGAGRERAGNARCFLDDESRVAVTRQLHVRINHVIHGVPPVVGLGNRS